MDDMGHGIVVAMGIIIIISVTWKRINTGARMGAILIVLVFLWLVIALVNSTSAALVAEGIANGFSQLITGIGHFIGMF